jgi:hypothetical protein
MVDFPPAQPTNLFRLAAEARAPVGLACGPLFALASLDDMSTGGVVQETYFCWAHVRWVRERRLADGFRGVDALPFELVVAAGDHGVIPVYADWLSDRGLEDYARPLREHHDYLLCSGT